MKTNRHYLLFAAGVLCLGVAAVALVWGILGVIYGVTTKAFVAALLGCFQLDVGYDMLCIRRRYIEQDRWFAAIKRANRWVP